MKKIVILGGARDYHAMDWYRAVRTQISSENITFLTDLIGGENFNIIINENDKIEKLFIIDNLLFNKQSKIGNIWRNIVKLLIMPIQIAYLKQYVRKNQNSIFHAHPMYYMFLSWLSNVEYIGTPQGSEILVRPYKSKLYRYFAIKSLQAAKFVTVDSLNMKQKIFDLSGVEAIVIQNGIDMDEISKFLLETKIRNKIVSIRAMTELYRIDEIIKARNKSKLEVALNFVYPFEEAIYKNNIQFEPYDKDIGRLNKEDLYSLLTEAKLVISIPSSDSSPRSVYESIFLGSCVAITYNPYYEILPSCMKERIYIIDLSNSNWFEDAVDFSSEKIKKKYIPSAEALEMFDQNISLKKATEQLY